MVFIIATIGLLALLKQRRAIVLAKGAAISDAAVPMPTNPHVDNQVTTAADASKYWGLNATGVPSLVRQPGRGRTPGMTSQFLKGPGILSGPVRPSRYAWSAPTGGRGPDAKASWPGGTFPGPSGPYPPASGNRAYAQSPVSSESPFLPETLDLVAPLAANSWFYNLSGVDPLVALAAGSGGYVMTERVDPARAIASAIGKR